MENKKKLVPFLVLLLFVVAFAEIIAEYLKNSLFIYIFKPLLVPILALLYWITSKERNNYFLAALFFSWLANIFYIATDFISIEIASIFFLLYRLLVIYIVIKILDVKNYFPVLLGVIPFAFFFIYTTGLTHSELGGGLFIYILQVLLISFLGGLSLSNYILHPDKKTAFWLLLSMILFSLNMFLLVIKLFYLEILLFQSILMFVHVIAQFSLCQFILLSENSNDNLFST